VRPLSALPGTEAKSLAGTLRALLAPALILARHPRTLVQLVGQCLTPTAPSSPRIPPTLVAALINASTAALLNAGSVPMRGVVCAVAVGRLVSTTTTTSASAFGAPASPAKSILVLDPSEAELASLEAAGCFAFMFAAGLRGLADSAGPCVPCEAVWTDWHAKSSFSEDELVWARALAQVGAVRVWRAMKESVRGMETSSFSSSSEWKKRTTAARQMHGHDVAGAADVDDDKMEI
jgi:exosome complex component RRP46